MRGGRPTTKTTTTTVHDDDVGGYTRCAALRCACLIRIVSSGLFLPSPLPGEDKTHGVETNGQLWMFGGE